MMRRAVNAWTRYWFAPAPVFDLAMTRVVVVGIQLYVLLPAAGSLGSYRALSALPDGMYDPLPILHLMVAPFGWMFRPDYDVLQAVYWIVLVTGATSLIGLLTNASLFVFACGNIFLQAFQYSFGDIHHNKGPTMVALVALALAPSGRAFSFDAWLARLRPKSEGESIPPSEATSRFARWPLLLIQWMLALAYFSAAYNKLRVAGLDWMNGHTLQYYILTDAERWGMPLGLWMGQHLGLVLIASWLTVIWEATFFLVLFFPALRWLYVPLGLGFHTGTRVMMNAGFVQFQALYAALIPWAAARRWWRDRRRGGFVPAADLQG
jgi:hypothetical protein